MPEPTSPDRGFDDLDTTTLLQALHRLGLADEPSDRSEAPVTGVSDTVRASAGAKLAGAGHRLLADHGSENSRSIRHWLLAQRDEAAGHPEAEARLRAVVQRLGWDQALLDTFSNSAAIPDGAPLKPLLTNAARTLGAVENLVLAAIAELLDARDGRESSTSAAAEDLRTVLDELGEAGLL